MEVGICTVSEKGQVTIPRDARRRLNLKAGDRVLFKVEGDKVIMVRVGGRRLSETLEGQKPWPITSVEYQRRLRAEWP
ncbi:AbrB/MazE/SpoVT family DNA-binding domain-containing protein [Candidatus Bathyarchaeota archaeon]|nr:AbrB/MazE/SpoVT family DNA-binding domain-containing protein [Candidatus Bathyarchaeota archaeon]